VIHFFLALLVGTLLPILGHKAFQPRYTFFRAGGF
jgi:hypothetical protein